MLKNKVTQRGKFEWILYLVRSLSDHNDPIDTVEKGDHDVSIIKIWS